MFEPVSPEIKSWLADRNHLSLGSLVFKKNSHKEFNVKLLIAVSRNHSQ
jgi:hypothetical protein